MTYDLYSIGDANYLVGVLNAVAALGGSGKYASLMSISLLIGLIFTAVKAIFSQKFELQNFLVAVVMYQVMFGVQARVIVNDVYSGAAMPVDNVPWGLAFIGSTMSGVGYDMARSMETAFSTPKMSTDGFGGALAMILNARRVDSFGPANFGCSAPVLDGPVSQADRKCSLGKSIENYVRDCVGPGIQQGFLSAEAIEQAPIDASASVANAWQAMATPFQAISTTLTFGDNVPPGGRPVTCVDAYSEISGRIDQASASPNFRKFVASRTGARTYESLDSAISAFGTASMGAQNFVLNQAVRNAYGRGLIISQEDQANATVLMSQATDQRNIQWAAEASIFSKLIRPIMTFFEGFIYATAPFMVFLIGLGPMGMSLVAKYLYLPIWISLWQPVMAIVNFYVNYIAEGRLSAFQGAEGSTFISLSGSLTAFSSMQDWLGTASMLAASVPAITGFLLYGGSQAFTALTSKLQSGDFVNEKTASPDIVNPAAAISTGAGNVADRAGGVRAFDADKNATSLNLSDTFQNVASSQSAVAQRSASAATQALTQKFSNTDAKSYTDEQLASLGGSVMASKDTALQSVAAQAYTDTLNSTGSVEMAKVAAGRSVLSGGGKLGLEGAFDKSKGLSNSEIAAVETSSSASTATPTGNGSNEKVAMTDKELKTAKKDQATKGSVRGSAGLSGGLSFEGAEGNSLTATQSANTGSGSSTSATMSDSYAARLAAAVVNSNQTSEKLAFARSLSSSQDKTTGTALSKSVEDTQQYQTANSAAQQFTASTNLDGSTMFNRFAGNAGVRGLIDSAVAGDSKLRDKMEEVGNTRLKSSDGSNMYKNADQQKAAQFVLAAQELSKQPGGEKYGDLVSDALSKDGFTPPQNESGRLAGLQGPDMSAINSAEAAANAVAPGVQAAAGQAQAAALESRKMTSAQNVNLSPLTPSQNTDVGGYDAGNRIQAAAVGTSEAQEVKGSQLQTAFTQTLADPAANGEGSRMRMALAKSIEAGETSADGLGMVVAAVQDAKAAVLGGDGNKLQEATEALQSYRNNVASKYVEQGVSPTQAQVFAEIQTSNQTQEVVKALGGLNPFAETNNFGIDRGQAVEAVRDDFLRGYGKDASNAPPDLIERAEEYADAAVSRAEFAALNSNSDAGMGVMKPVIDVNRSLAAVKQADLNTGQ